MIAEICEWSPVTLDARLGRHSPLLEAADLVARHASQSPHERGNFLRRQILDADGNLPPVEELSCKCRVAVGERCAVNEHFWIRSGKVDKVPGDVISENELRKFE